MGRVWSYLKLLFVNENWISRESIYLLWLNPNYFFLVAYNFWLIAYFKNMFRKNVLGMLIAYLKNMFGKNILSILSPIIHQYSFRSILGWLTLSCPCNSLIYESFTIFKLRESRWKWIYTKKPKKILHCANWHNKCWLWVLDIFCHKLENFSEVWFNISFSSLLILIQEYSA